MAFATVEQTRLVHVKPKLMQVSGSNFFKYYIGRTVRAAVLTRSDLSLDSKDDYLAHHARCDTFVQRGGRRRRVDRAPQSRSP